MNQTSITTGGATCEKTKAALSAGLRMPATVRRYQSPVLVKSAVKNATMTMLIRNARTTFGGGCSPLYPIGFMNIHIRPPIAAACATIHAILLNATHRPHSEGA